MFLAAKNTWFFFGFSEPPAVETAHGFPGFHHFFSGKISPIDSTDTRLDGELESSKPRGIHLLETSRISGWKITFFCELNHLPLHMTKFYQNKNSPFSPKCWRTSTFMRYEMFMMASFPSIKTTTVKLHQTGFQPPPCPVTCNRTAESVKLRKKGPKVDSQGGTVDPNPPKPPVCILRFF